MFDKSKLDLETLVYARGMVRKRILAMKELQNSTDPKVKLMDGVRVRIPPAIEVLSQMDLEMSELIKEVEYPKTGDKTA